MLEKQRELQRKRQQTALQSGGKFAAVKLLAVAMLSHTIRVHVGKVFLRLIDTNMVNI